MLDHKLVTAPDFDHTRSLKLMFVDFDWNQIEEITKFVERCPLPVTVYLYGENEIDHQWAMTAAYSCDRILVNCQHKGKIELLKGALLTLSYAESYGDNDQAVFSIRKNYDVAEWLTRAISVPGRHQAISR